MSIYNSTYYNLKLYSVRLFLGMELYIEGVKNQ